MSFLTGSLYPNIFLAVSQCMWLAVVYTVVVYFWGLYVYNDIIVGEVLFILSYMLEKL